MPIYEYQCKNCGHRLEKLQKLSDAPLVTCPECDQDALSKLVSAAGFRLKGGGWYETDFKKDNKKNLAADSNSASPPSSGSDTPSSGSDKSGSSSGGAASSATKTSAPAA